MNRNLKNEKKLFRTHCTDCLNKNRDCMGTDEWCRKIHALSEAPILSSYHDLEKPLKTESNCFTFFSSGCWTLCLPEKQILCDGKCCGN